MNNGKTKLRKFYLPAAINEKGGHNVEFMRPFLNKKNAIRYIKLSYLHTIVNLLTFECTKEEQIIGGKRNANNQNNLD
jgi:hypothetical protein